MQPKTQRFRQNPAMNAKTLMIQGTTSDAGKASAVAGLCRLLAARVRHLQTAKHGPEQRHNRGWRRDWPRPGGAGPGRFSEPHTDMNPVLLKPNTDIGAQVIVQPGAG